MIQVRIRKNSFIKAFVLAVATAVLLRTCVVGIYKVPTTSMLPNLYVGDLIMAWKFPYNAVGKFLDLSLFSTVGELNRGDILVFRHPQNSSLYVKRLIGLPGDRLKIENGILYINDLPFGYKHRGALDNFAGHEHYDLVEESYADANWSLLIRSGEKQVDFPEVVVPQESIFVLGDNRNSSDDSRDWGSVSLRNIEARVVYNFFSFNWKQEPGEQLIRWERSFLKIK